MPTAQESLKGVIKKFKDEPVNGTNNATNTELSSSNRCRFFASTVYGKPDVELSR